jgi:AcrR family transcriptional regulator
VPATSPSDHTDQATTARRHRRDPQGHRAAILRAAREAFAEKGYARATIRDIAKRADVTHGLVMRQFTSKENLFLAAVPGHRDLPELTAGNTDALPDRIAAAFIHRMETNTTDDPLVTMIRSAAAHESAATRLADVMQEHSQTAYGAVLCGDDVDVRVALLGAQLIGLAFSRYIVKSGPLAAMSADDATRHLARVLRQILLT